MPLQSEGASAPQRGTRLATKPQSGACLLLILLSFLPAGSSAATFSVNATDDLDDGGCDAIHCSLREAIIAANATQSVDLIEFASLGSGDQTITPLTALPELAGPTTINGATHPDGTIYLCATELSTSDVLIITAGTTIIYALRIECPVQGPRLTMSKTGQGSGVVTSSPAGIDCGADCAEAYDLGSVVALTATPDAGSAFAGWSGDADCADGTVTLDADTACTASFDLNQRTLTVGLAGSGNGTVTSSPAGIDCGADCAQAYDLGSLVTLTANPDTGSTFTGWSGDADCADGAVTLDGDTACTASFDASQRTLSVSVTGSGSGTVTSSPAGIDCGADCSESYPHKTVVDLIAAPDAGSTFTGWSGDSDCTDGRVTLKKNTACTAAFDEGAQATLTVTVSGGGRVTSNPAGIDCGADCAEAYDLGSVVTLTATPDPGHTFVNWSGDADCADSTIALDSDAICTATFSSSLPTVTILIPASGSTFAEYNGIDFVASAVDSNGFDITGGIVWTSSKDGALGVGDAVSVVLSKGNHMITAAASDGAGGIGTDSVSLRVRPAHLVLSGMSVDSQETHEAGLSITATDFEILSSGDVLFSSGELISLGDGFVVASGGTFSAGTDPTLVP